VNETCVHAIAVRVGQDVFIVDLKTAQAEFTLCNDGVLDGKVFRKGAFGFKVNIYVFPQANHKCDAMKTDDHFSSCAVKLFVIHKKCYVHKITILVKIRFLGKTYLILN